MTAFDTPPQEARPADSPPGSRLETCRLLLQLAGDLLSVPFHLLAYLMTVKAHRRRFRAALEQGAAGLAAPDTNGATTRP